MQSFAPNHKPEKYVWMLPDVKEEATEEKVARASQIPRPRMSVKLDDLVMLIPVI